MYLKKMPIEKLCCEVLDFNTAVVRLHQRFGFIKEGFLQKHIYRDDGVFRRGGDGAFFERTG
ncbi:GNAT family N-acetyltransferase [Candidatus Accumulibacter phosphatis]|uniref:GNAT family N-acetyltransferase n=1 Tax=Candidatus Accumulibacter contiguus TaxID=2954381 RepID=A0ABX1TBM1_9PROT|nr:GNAT family N-acetyltransferase [Candidatus Accumulibacter contiguus]